MVDRDEVERLAKWLDFPGRGLVSYEAAFALRALSAELERAEREQHALVAAAYEAAAKAMGAYHWNRYRTKTEGGMLSSPAVFTSHTWQAVQEICRALTPDDAREALETVRRQERQEGIEIARQTAIIDGLVEDNRDVTRRLAEAERERDEAREWAGMLAETLMAVNAQHGGRNAARLLKDYRDYRAAIRGDDT